MAPGNQRPANVALALPGRASFSMLTVIMTVNPFLALPSHLDRFSFPVYHTLSSFPANDNKSLTFDSADEHSWLLRYLCSHPDNASC